MPGRTKPGEVTACSIQFRGDGFLRKEGIRSHLDFVSPPVFSGLSPVFGVSKKCYGMLNVLPPVVPVKRIHLHIVARKCYRYRIGKIRLASSKLRPDLAAPGGSG